MYSVDNVAQATGDPRGKIASYWPLVAAAMRRYGIYSHACQIAIIATVGTECDWTYLTELGDCSYLEGRTDIGNTQPGDGCLYKGRGFVQLTGRHEYQYYGQILGLDLLGNPDQAADPAVAAQTLCLYFRDNGIPEMARRGDWRAVRRTVNGGYNGWDRYIGIINALSDMPEPPDGPAVTTVAVACTLYTQPRDTSPPAIDPQHRPVHLAVGTVVHFVQPLGPQADPTWKRGVTLHWAHVQVGPTVVHGWILRANLHTEAG